MCERRAAVMNERLTSWGTGRRPAPGAVLPKKYGLYGLYGQL